MLCDGFDDFGWRARITLHSGAWIHSFQVIHCRVNGVGFGLRFAGGFLSGGQRIPAEGKRISESTRVRSTTVIMRPMTRCFGDAAGLGRPSGNTSRLCRYGKSSLVRARIATRSRSWSGA